MGTEREAKLDVWPGFEIPDLAGVSDGITVGPESAGDLDATYFDTPDLRLIRSGITVRFRDEGHRAVWTIKFPGDDTDAAAGTLVRREIDLDGPAGSPPRAVRALLAARVRSASLGEVARIQTRRRRRALCDSDGAERGEIDDDEVSVLHGDRMAARFREVEVELADGGSPDLLAAVVDRLKEAGASAGDAAPKVMRALGPGARAAPELAVEPADPAPDATAAAAVRAGLATAVGRIIDHHHVVCLDDDPEGVHQMRVGTRRLRSDLRTYGPLLDSTITEPLRDELAWLASGLGRVRDADVLGRRLREAIDGLEPSDGEAAAWLPERLGRDRDAAQAALVGVLGTDRYLSLLDRLVALAEAPPLGPGADAPAATVLPELVAGPWRRLRKAVDALGPDPGTDAIHAMRMQVKRARYAVEVAAPIMGEPARRSARALAGLQDLLGAQTDAIVAERWLRGAAREAGADEAFVAGRLAERERAAAGDLRAAWEQAWPKASAKKRWTWLT